MKKALTLMLALVMVLILSLSAFADDGNTISLFELPKPQTPNYFKYESDIANGVNGILTMLAITDQSVAMLAQEYDTDSDAFLAKYGLDSFDILQQYDISLDGENNWQYTSEWDSEPYIGGYGDGYQGHDVNGALMEDFEFFWRPRTDFIALPPPITTRDWEPGFGTPLPRSRTRRGAPAKFEGTRCEETFSTPLETFH